MTATAHGSHRVLRALAGVRESLGEGAGASVWSMSAGEAAAGLSEVQSARAQLAALEARLLVQAHAADAPGLIGATSTPNWFAHHTRVTRLQAHRQWRLASGLEDVSRPQRWCRCGLLGRPHLECWSAALQPPWGKRSGFEKSAPARRF